MPTTTRDKRKARRGGNQASRRSRSPERKPRRPSLRKEFGLTRKTLARMAGLSDRTLATWEDGGEISEASERLVTPVKRLLYALAEVVDKNAISAWLEKPNEAFGGLKPLEVMERGETDRLWRMIYFMGSGTAS
jgi:DNA-binding XRE family transcriptional regulator